MILSRGKPYADRRDAAGRLMEGLVGQAACHPVVLGIPRGGVIIADVVSRELNADLDVVLTRKLGAPGNPELAIGAVTENGVVFVHRLIADRVGADDDYIQRERATQLVEIRARRERYRVALSKVPVESRSVILVDDGIATGATMLASIWAAREEGASRVVVAAPLGAWDAIKRLERDADEVICPCVPSDFYAIGQFFDDFGQIGDDEVLEILRMHSRGVGGSVPG